MTIPLLQELRYTFCQTLCTKRDKTEPPAPETTQKRKAEIIWKDGLPPKEHRKDVQLYWHKQRAHAPVEMSKPVENETNYRAKVNR